MRIYLRELSDTGRKNCYKDDSVLKMVKWFISYMVKYLNES